MQELTIEFRGKEYFFKYFFDTVSIGGHKNSPIYNVYTFLPEGKELNEFIGDGIHVLLDTTNPSNNNYSVALIHPVLHDAGIAEREIKELIVNKILEGLK